MQYETGKCAESTAQRFLEEQGLHAINNNYRCKHGEIDLIMRHNDTIVFVEVRLRRNNRYGSGAETVDQRKQAKIIACAWHFLQKNNKLAKAPCRFDVVSLTNKRMANGKNDLEWIPNAFTA